MKYFHKIAENESVAALLAAIMRQPELWNQNQLRTTFKDSPHHEVSDIWLRFNDILKHQFQDNANPLTTGKVGLYADVYGERFDNFSVQTIAQTVEPPVVETIPQYTKQNSIIL